MSIYIYLLSFIIILSILESHLTVLSLNGVKIKTTTISFWSCFIFILIIGILRDELLGVDVHNYKKYFAIYNTYSLSDSFFNNSSDLGYVLLNIAIGKFTSDFWIAKAIMYTIVFGLFSYVIYKESKLPALSFLIYIGFGFLGFNFCILRQAIAVSISLYAFKYVIEKKLFKFLIIVWLAILMHKTAIFYIFIYPLLNIKIKEKYFLKKTILLLGSILCGIFIIPIILNLYRNNYQETQVMGEGINLLIFYIILYAFLKFISYKNSKVDKVDIDISYTPIYFQIISYFFSLFNRVTSYYTILLTISIPNILIKSKNKKLYVYIIIAIFSFMYILSLSKNSTGIVPYKINV